MGVEVEKKYRLTAEQQANVVERLRATGAEFVGEEFETNTLYAGNTLDTTRAVLRLRRTNTRSVLTYKERGAVDASGVKRHREDETEVADSDALASIFDALGYRPSLIYEKRRATWNLCGVEVVIDELPFGLYAEIEGDEADIRAVETKLGIQDAAHEDATYPDLAARYGRRRDEVIEARFAEE